MAALSMPGETHRQRSLAGYGPWDHKESVTTEGLYHSRMKSFESLDPLPLVPFLLGTTVVS